MVQMIDDKLLQLNADLLLQLQELQSVINRARTARTSADCPICQPDEQCAAHKHASRASVKALTARIQELEEQLIKEQMLTEAAENALSNEMESSKTLRDALPRMLELAREDAVATLPELEKRDKEHVEYVFRLAKRLGIHPDTSLFRVQSMLEDAIRKLVK
jgi:hypothetical protein